ncbi:lipocalin family protein [Gelidibacter maritimus]|uniref:Lipocalin family protein n=1 Tax=Gelidibacter maritimus TaxID=2761487 RepID=A0A7W2M832_9FLAO|nr:lipocalin family protein [Gelidibacter maritimus]MBA6154456.1 lipocalin family protein [Gelidibacter maritimus]
MKKIGITLFMAALLVSCSLSKIEKSARNTIDGNWVLNSVTYDEPGVFNTILFEDATASCFTDSQWFFRSNNSTGTYTIIDTDCSTGVRYFRWAANEIGKDTGDFEFTLKFTDEKKNDLEDKTGYRMKMKYLDANSMQITQTIQFEGKPFNINLNFTRTTL